MTEFTEYLRTLQRKLFWQIRLRSLMELMLVALITIFVLGGTDFLLRPRLTLFRLLISIVFWSVILFELLFRLVPAWLKSVSLVDVAFAIEDSQKTVNGEIAAAVKLLESSGAGKKRIANDWVEAIFQRVSATRLTELPKVRTKSLVILWVIMFLVVLVTVGTVPAMVKTGVSRVLWPSGTSTWPQQTKLVIQNHRGEIVSPDSILSVTGTGSVALRATDVIGVPPDHVILEIRRTAEPLQRIRLQPKRAMIGDGKFADVFEFRIVPDSADSTLFRVVGGDHRSMPWLTLLRESLPIVQSIACVIIPPDYLRAPSRRVENWVGPLDVPAGSTLQFEIDFDRAVSAFEVRYEGNSPAVPQWGNRLHVSFEMQVEAMLGETPTLELFAQHDSAVHTSQEGSAPWHRVRRIALEIIEDAPPQVELELPEKDLSVTRNAVLPLRARAVDDHGLKQFSIEMTGQTEFSLTTADVQYKTSKEIQGTLAIDRTGAVAGDVIEVFALASDYAPASAAVATAPVRISIVADQTKEQLLKEQLLVAVKQVIVAYDSQRTLRAEVEQLQKQFESAVLESQDLQGLSKLKTQHQRVGLLLTNLIERGDIEGIQRQLELNRLKSPLVRDAARALHQSLSRFLRREHPANEASLHDLLQRLSDMRPQERHEQKSDEIRDAFATAMLDQNRAVGTLEELIRQLQQWSEFADWRTQWQLVIADLKKEANELVEVAQSMVSKPFAALTPQQQQFLTQSANAHLELSQNLQSLIADLEGAPEKRWQQLRIRLMNSESQVKLAAAASAIQSNNILRAIDIDRLLIDEFEKFNEEFSQKPNTDGREFLREIQELNDQLKAASVTQSDLHRQWQASDQLEEILVKQLQLKSDLQMLTVRFEEIGLTEIRDLLAEVVSRAGGIQRLARDKALEEIEQELSAIDELLNKAQALLAETLQRFQRRNESLWIKQLAELARELIVKHTELVQKYDVIAADFERDQRVDRRQRRALREFAEVVDGMADQLQPFHEQTGSLEIVSQTLAALDVSLNDLSDRLQMAVVRSETRQLLSKIEDALLQLAAMSAEGEAEAEVSVNQRLPFRIRAQLAILLERQRLLIQREQQELAIRGSLPAAAAEAFREEQIQIFQTLEELLAMPVD